MTQTILTKPYHTTQTEFHKNGIYIRFLSETDNTNTPDQSLLFHKFIQIKTLGTYPQIPYKNCTNKETLDYQDKIRKYRDKFTAGQFTQQEFMGKINTLPSTPELLLSSEWTPPQVISKFQLDSTDPWIRTVLVNDTLAFALFVTDVLILNISNPTSPTLLSRIFTNPNRSISNIAVYGTTLYVIKMYKFYIYDISNPEAPIQQNFFDSEEDQIAYGGINIFNDTLYIGRQNQIEQKITLQIYNITTRSPPIFSGEYNDTCNECNYGEYSIKYSEEFVYLTDSLEKTLLILNITNPANPTFQDKLTFMAPNGGPIKVDIRGDLIYLLLYDGGLKIFDKTDMFSIQNVFNWHRNVTGFYSGFDLIDELLFLSSFDSGFEILNISDFSTPVSLGSYGEGGGVTSVQYSNGLLYAGLTENGIHIVDPGFDSDTDGLPDQSERYIYLTNTAMMDTDNDGLNDGDEVLIHKTDPLLLDSDGDSFNDGAEINAGTDPLNDFSFPGSPSISKTDISNTSSVISHESDTKQEESQSPKIPLSLQFPLFTILILIKVKSKIKSDLKK